MKILIAEDDAVSRRVLEGFLTKWGHQVVATKNGTEAWWELGKENAPQLAILDWMMPGMDGIELCREIRSRGPESYIYVLLLTAKGQKQDVVNGIEAGADDYLTKPFDPHELKVRIRAGIRILELQETLRVQAMLDSLTGLWNRRGISDQLRKELSRSVRRGSQVGIILADLDHFKMINDRYGHDAGDAVLRETATRMKSAVRAYDHVGRYGGEEFLICAPECDAQGASALAERIRLRLTQEPMFIPQARLSVTASFGVAACDSLAANDTDVVVKAVDEALYCAKEKGRNRIEMATPALAVSLNSAFISA